MTHAHSAEIMERRSRARVACGVRAQVRAAGGESLAAEITNISEQGLFLRPAGGSTRDSLRMTFVLGAGKTLVFRLRVAGDAVAREARGRVAWRSDVGVGVEFVEIDDRLHDFVSRLVTSGDGASALLATIAPDPTVDVD